MSYADEGAFEACEDPVRTCRDCGEIYSEFALDYRPDVEVGCPNCYEDKEPEELAYDKAEVQGPGEGMGAPYSCQAHPGTTGAV